MKLVDTTAALYKNWGMKGAIKLLKEAGFDGYDTNLWIIPDSDSIFNGDDYLEVAKDIRTYADSLNMPCLQAHAPVKTFVTEADVDAFIEKIRRSMRIAAILGAPIIIVHPGNDFTPQENYDFLYKKLLPLAHELNIVICTENMWNWDSEKQLSYPAACGSVEDFCQTIDIANDSHLKACLDIGHATMTGAPGAVELVKGLGKDRLAALHVHDNDSVLDLHTAPFSANGKVNWPAFINALKEIGYEGNFTYETCYFEELLPKELQKAGLVFLHDIGRYFIEKVGH